MKTRPANLPKLIFLEENHSSPLFAEILTEWLPKLKEKGYSHFYDEIPSNITMMELTNKLKDKLNTGKENQPYFEKLYDLAMKLIKEENFFNLAEKIFSNIDGNDIKLVNNAIQFTGPIFAIAEGFFSTLDESTLTNPDALQKKIDEVTKDKLSMLTSTFIELLNAMKSDFQIQNIIFPQALIGFYQGLNLHHIDFQAIDAYMEKTKYDELSREINFAEDNEANTKLEANTQFVQELTSSEGVHSRNQEMLPYYLSSTLAFGRMGYMHAENFQQLILEKMTLKEANEKFTFIYLYEGPALVQAQALMRENKLNLPVKTIMVDLTDRIKINLDELFDKITAPNTKIEPNTISSKYMHYLLGNSGSKNNQEQNKEVERSTSSFGV